ncbi:MAG: MATE family efflux transporter [Bacteroidetes bacterium GWF2_38_335]|nr:MAG: MATE family efflux transporter [Bacteroidetes bacterium GWF2_38_335]OFY76921.1 MAG: MATE family efflux transporter [Bacteroidetes bacterium RIFOXYA12_FULL_38_20]HBS86770.1 MATE family efflux transporter [Bacteroidales bacterium]
MLNPNGKFRGFLRILKESVTGSERDFTQTSIRNAIILLSIPMVLEMLMESIFALVDIWFVSRLGNDPIAIVGFTESFMTIIYSVAVGLSTATTAVVSRRIGEKNREGASVAAFQAIAAAMAFSAVVSVPGIIYAKELLMLMGVSEVSAEEYYGYTSIMLGSNCIIMLLFVMNAVFRSSGDAAVSMKVLLIANGINIVLDPLLIFGYGPFPELGIEGAAIATVIGRGVGVAIQLWILFSGKKRVALVKNQLKIKWDILKELVKLSTGGMAQHLIATSSWIGMVWIIGNFGSAVMAGYTIAIRIIVFVILPAWGISNAASTLVGQNLGANQPGKAERSVWIIGFVNSAVMGFIGLIIIVFSSQLMSFFTNDAAVISAGITALTIISSGFVFYAFGMVMIQAFNGAGDTRTPTLVNIVCFWMMELPLAWFLAMNQGFDEEGAYFAILISESFMTLLSIYLFRKGRWKLKKV